MNINDAQAQMGYQPGGASLVSGNNIQDLFLKMMLAQIENQDPTNPMDSSQQISQMAQMAQLESMETMKTLLNSNTMLMSELQLLSTANLVGQDVMVETDQIELGKDGVMKGRFTLTGSAEKTAVIVKDVTGKETRIELGKQTKGAVDLTIDAQKLGLKPGSYSLRVEVDGAETKLPLEIAGTVNSVRLSSAGGTFLNIAGLGDVPYQKIRQFGTQKTV